MSKFCFSKPVLEFIRRELKINPNRFCFFDAFKVPFGLLHKIQS